MEVEKMLDFEQINIIKEQITKDNAYEFQDWR